MQTIKSKAERGADSGIGLGNWMFREIYGLDSIIFDPHLFVWVMGFSDYLKKQN